MKIMNSPVIQQAEEMDKVQDASRRRFFQLAGGVAGAGLLLAACRKVSSSTTTYIGSGDTALLNYLYILEQVEAAFYTQAVATPYYGLTTSESQLLTDVRDQEIAHREFLKALIGKDAIPKIVCDFSAVTFADRTSVLTYAIAIEDLVVSGFNGCVHLFSNTGYVLPISKMVTVEARHSAYFRDILTYNSFGNSSVIDANGLDQAAPPATVLGIAQGYIQTRFDSRQLPNQ
jgi:ferritin-like protein